MATPRPTFRIGWESTLWTARTAAVPTSVLARKSRKDHSGPRVIDGSPEASARRIWEAAMPARELAGARGPTGLKTRRTVARMAPFSTISVTRSVASSLVLP